MEARKCDRCGKLYEVTDSPLHTKDFEYRFNSLGIAMYADSDYSIFKFYDLCDDCRNSFVRWLVM